MGRACDWMPEEDRRMEAMLERGMRPRRIAAELGRTEKSVWSRMARIKAGLKPNPRIRPWGVEQDTLLIALRREGLDNRQIAERMGRTVSGVASRANVLRERGLQLESNRGRNFAAQCKPEDAFVVPPEHRFARICLSVRMHTLTEMNDRKEAPVYELRDEVRSGVVPGAYHGPQPTPESIEAERLEAMRANVARYVREWKAGRPRKAKACRNRTQAA